MALVVIELETLVSEPDALTTRPPPCAATLDLSLLCRWETLLSQLAAVQISG